MLIEYGHSCMKYSFCSASQYPPASPLPKHRDLHGKVTILLCPYDGQAPVKPSYAVRRHLLLLLDFNTQNMN